MPQTLCLILLVCLGCAHAKKLSLGELRDTICPEIAAALSDETFSVFTNALTTLRDVELVIPPEAKDLVIIAPTNAAFATALGSAGSRAVLANNTLLEAIIKDHLMYTVSVDQDTQKTLSGEDAKIDFTFINVTDAQPVPYRNQSFGCPTQIALFADGVIVPEFIRKLASETPVEAPVPGPADPPINVNFPLSPSPVEAPTEALPPAPVPAPTTATPTVSPPASIALPTASPTGASTAVNIVVGAKAPGPQTAAASGAGRVSVGGTGVIMTVATLLAACFV